MSKEAISRAVREAIEIPPYVNVCANMVRYDLLHGPAFARLPEAGIEAITDDDLALLYSDAEESCKAGDVVVEVYTSIVADTLRDYIDGLPTLYYEDSGYCSECEPCGEEIDGEWYEPADYYKLEPRAVCEALFGRIIAWEFK
jgi:hypothetical protein